MDDGRDDVHDGLEEVADCRYECHVDWWWVMLVVIGAKASWMNGSKREMFALCVMQSPARAF
jgi:hypothetical protein